MVSDYTDLAMSTVTQTQAIPYTGPFNLLSYQLQKLTGACWAAHGQHSHWPAFTATSSLQRSSEWRCLCVLQLTLCSFCQMQFMSVTALGGILLHSCYKVMSIKQYRAWFLSLSAPKWVLWPLWWKLLLIGLVSLAPNEMANAIQLIKTRALASFGTDSLVCASPRGTNWLFLDEKPFKPDTGMIPCTSLPLSQGLGAAPMLSTHTLQISFPDLKLRIFLIL